MYYYLLLYAVYNAVTVHRNAARGEVPSEPLEQEMGEQHCLPHKTSLTLSNLS